MARKKKREKRPVESYVSAAKDLAKLVPSLNKYKNRKRLKPSEKSAITRKEKLLKGIPRGSLFPVSKKQARKLKPKLFAPGVRAIQLRNVGPEATVKIVGSDIQIREPGNRRWIYWGLDRETVRSKRRMRDAGADAFEKRFPIEKVSDLAAKAFGQLKVQQVHLWAHAGIVGDGFLDLGAFIRWVNEKWNAGRYARDSVMGGDSDPGKWVNGIAILIEDPEYTKRRKAANVIKSAK